MEMLAGNLGPQIDSWIMILIFLVLVIGFIASALIVSYLLVPHRTGPVKQMPYESGIDPVGQARRRINPHFYLIALLFLLFDVELVFLYPWAGIFGSRQITASDRALLFAGMAAFIILLGLAYAYAWLKGVFRWRND